MLILLKAFLTLKLKKDIHGEQLGGRRDGRRRGVQVEEDGEQPAYGLAGRSRRRS
jgi:hypothetical protein